MNEIIDAMNRLADDIVDQIAKNSMSRKIAAGTEMVPAVETTPHVYEVSVITKAPQALAFEYGSGLHRTVGTPGTILITPKTKPMLHFVWKERGLGWVHFRQVNHPGVEPRPFFKVSVDEVLGSSSAYQSLRMAVRSNIIKTIRTELKVG